MLDQMFTAENFRRIYDVENRKGLDLATRYFPTLEPHTLAIRDKINEIREHRALEPTAAADVFKATMSALKAELADLMSGQRRGTITLDMPPPLLVVEVVSPGKANEDRDYRYKRSEYAARGIAEYWIVDPEARQVTLCRWVSGQYEDQVYSGDEPLQSALVPAFGLTPAELFS